MSRDEAERDLAHALSRHVGYTSGAFDLHRIFAVVQFFRDKTSAYTQEIVEYLENISTENTATAAYLAEVVNFSSSFGIIESVSSRDSKLTRYAATELGRSVLGALSIDDVEFRKFFMTNVVMLADADFLIPLMIHVSDQIKTPLLDYFCAFAEDLRSRRYEWLATAFPQPVLLERIASHVTWLRKKRGGLVPYTVEVPTLNTARHHARPRLGWLSDLGLSEDSSETLTEFGRRLLRAVVRENSYFWIAPNPSAMAALSLTNPPSDANELDFGLSSGSEPPSDAEVEALAIDTAATMVSAFREAKLIHADQASLMLPIAYIQYRSYKDRRSYNWQIVLESIFETNRNTLRRYSAHKGKVGFYKLVTL